MIPISQLERESRLARARFECEKNEINLINLLKLKTQLDFWNLRIGKTYSVMDYMRSISGK
jgi:hypothetical protein